MSSEAEKRNNGLDFIKILATTAVVFHHYQFVSGVRFDNHINFFGNHVFQWGIVVNLFFMISGFLAFRSAGINTKSLPFSSYLGRKLNRLLPVAACSSICYAGLSFLYIRTYRSGFWINDLPDIWDLIVVCLGLNSGFGLDVMSINNPLWFVSTLILCYCYYYLLSFLMKKRSWCMEWVLVIVVFTMLNCLHLHIQLPLLNEDAQKGYLYFSIGLLLGSLLDRYKLTRGLKALSIVIILVFAGFIIGAPAYIDTTNFFSFMVCPALIILSRTNTSHHLFRHTFWQTFSKISYNVYVWHFTIQLFCTFMWPAWMSSGKVADMYLFGAVTWLVGIASYFFLEKPLRKAVPALWSALFIRKDQ